MNGISTKEEEIDKNMTQVLFAGFFQKIPYKSRWVLQYPSSLDRLVHSFTIFCIRKRTRKNIKASIPFSTCYMKSGICCSHSEAYIMLTLSKKKEENENLSDIIKQAMFQDYKLAYSEKGDAHTEEANSTVTVG